MEYSTYLSPHASHALPAPYNESSTNRKSPPGRRSSLRRRVIAAGTLASLAAALAGCGGGSGNSITTNQDTILTETGADNSASGDFSGRLLLSWSPPTSRENQVELNWTEIQGYRIYYKNLSTDEPENVIDFADNNTTEYAVAVNSKGTYEFSMSVYDWNDLESQRSSIVTVDVN